MLVARENVKLTKAYVPLPYEHIRKLNDCGHYEDGHPAPERRKGKTEEYSVEKIIGRLEASIPPKLRPAPAPEHAPAPARPAEILVFNDEDLRMLQRITDGLQSERRDGARGGIMGYGRFARQKVQDDNPLTWYNFTKDMVMQQFALRGINMPGIDRGNIGLHNTLRDWVMSLPGGGAIHQDATRYAYWEQFKVENGIDMSVGHRQFIDAIQRFKAFQDYYNEWANLAERGRFQGLIAPLIINLLENISQSKGKCSTGASGRAIVTDRSILEFFKDHHPTWPAR